MSTLGYIIKSSGFFNTLLLLANLVFAGFNLYYLCKDYPRTQDLDIDYVGVIVGVLSILVTLLVGWQIFQNVDFSRRLKKIEAEFERFNNDSRDKIQNYEVIINQKMDYMDSKAIDYTALLSMQRDAYGHIDKNDYVGAFFLLVDCLVNTDKLGEDGAKEIYVKEILNVLELDTHRDIDDDKGKQSLNTIKQEIENNIDEYRDILQKSCSILIKMGIKNAVTLYNFINNILEKSHKQLN